MNELQEMSRIRISTQTEKLNSVGYAFCVVIRMCKFTFHSKVKKKIQWPNQKKKLNLNEIRSHNENKNRTAFTNTEHCHSMNFYRTHSFCFPQKTPYQRLISRNSMNVICPMWIHTGVPLSQVNTIRYFMYMIPTLECIFECFYFILSNLIALSSSTQMICLRWSRKSFSQHLSHFNFAIHSFWKFRSKVWNIHCIPMNLVASIY